MELEKRMKLRERTLFILDLANNHFGDLRHAKQVILRHAEVIAKHQVTAAIKFQFRDLDTYVSRLAKIENGKYVQRFESTRMEKESFGELVEFARTNGFITMATPFDEIASTWLPELNVDVAKIASASADDWGLLDSVSKLQLPVVASTGGLALTAVDDLYHFLRNQSDNFALMHCVSVYPSPNSLLQLRQIQNFSHRYTVPIGWSTHEDPDDVLPICLATALGSQLFERHIGLATDRYKLNNYSSTPEQIDLWLQAFKRSTEALGSLERVPASEDEIATLMQLKRGWYSMGVNKSAPFTLATARLQFPLNEGQIPASQRASGLFAHDIMEDEPIKFSDVIEPQDNSNRLAVESSQVHKLMLEVRGLVCNAKIPLNKELEVELSHHYGISRFREYGCTLITSINRSYAKKLLVLLPRQKNPLHHHKIKEEMFQLLYGDAQLTVDGVRFELKPGEVCLVPVGAWHKFQSSNGAVIEEISTTHLVSDSYYEDKQIQNNSNRKTLIGKPYRYFDWAN